ncbi:MAG TPA: hypothetical protein VI432_02170 [Candidatus Paceibacterota bacterium]
MTSKQYLQISGSLFLIIGSVHFLRIIYGWEASVAGWSVPMWISWLALLLAGYLSFNAFSLSKR